MKEYVTRKLRKHPRNTENNFTLQLLTSDLNLKICFKYLISPRCEFTVRSNLTQLELSIQKFPKLKKCIIQYC